MRPQMLRIIQPGDAAQRRQTLENLCQRVAGHAKKVDEAARLLVAKSVLLQMSQVETGFEDVFPARPRDVFRKLVDAGGAVLRIVRLISQRRKPENLNLGVAGIARVGRDRRNPPQLIQVVVDVLLNPPGREAVEPSRSSFS